MGAGLNGQRRDGTDEHPTQALLDAHAMLRHFRAHDQGDLAGKVVAITGDLLHSRVAVPTCCCCNGSGRRWCSWRRSHPHAPRRSASWGARVVTDIDEVIADAT